MGYLFLLLVGVMILFWLTHISSKNKIWQEKLNDFAKNEGLNLFHRVNRAGYFVALDDSQNSMCFLEKTNNSEVKIFRAKDFQQIRLEVGSGNHPNHKIIFRTNDPKNPTLELDFGISGNLCQDFYDRVIILFGYSN